jgi:hypothetical protein
MNNGKQKAFPRWYTPPKEDDYDARKEHPDAGMILKRNKAEKRAEAPMNLRPGKTTKSSGAIPRRLQQSKGR